MSVSRYQSKTERVERGSQPSISFRQIARVHRIKQWRNFLCNSQNKTHLIEFLVSDWSSESQRKKLIEKDVYVTLSDIHKHLTEKMVCEVDDLKCTHAEADTRMILHAVHCSTTGSNGVSEDTDVFLLCAAFHHKCLVFCMSSAVPRQGLNILT